MPDFLTAALYKFVTLPDHAALQAPLQAFCEAKDVRGTLLLACEGINGTIAGAPDSIAHAIDHIRALPDCAELDVKLSAAATMPFERMKVRVKAEIVTMGEPGIDPRVASGTYVAPQDWNALIADPDTIVIDTRNDYEVAIGSFEGAIDPATRSFREFPPGSAPDARNCSALAVSPGSRCSAPAGFGVRNRPPF